MVRYWGTKFSGISPDSPYVTPAGDATPILRPSPQPSQYYVWANQTLNTTYTCKWITYLCLCMYVFIRVNLGLHLISNGCQEIPTNSDCYLTGLPVQRRTRRVTLKVFVAAQQCGLHSKWLLFCFVEWIIVISSHYVLSPSNTVRDFNIIPWSSRLIEFTGLINLTLWHVYLQEVPQAFCNSSATQNLFRLNS